MSFSPTIAAIATPLARGGIGILRLSGNQSIAIASSVFRPYCYRGGPEPYPDLAALTSHHLYPGRIYDGARVIDEVLLAVMKAPHSYTGENVVEIYAHGGPFVLKTILNLLLQEGAELAAPGEFTRRAFLSGRMDLTQAEAVADIVAAVSDRALAAAASQITGVLRDRIQRIRQEVLSVLTNIDAAVDVDEQMEEELSRKEIVARLQEPVLEEIEGLICRHDTLADQQNGLRVVLAGAPNVGKSSLYNHLVGAERAIVARHPGTTRDVIESALFLDGRQVFLADTAGFRSETASDVEQMGMAQAEQAIGRAHLVLLLVDGAAGVSARDYSVFARVKDKPVIVVINKIDLLSDANHKIVPQLWRDRYSVVALSAKTGEGLSSLWHELEFWMRDSEPPFPDDTIPNLRHKKALETSRTAVLSAISALEKGVPPDVVVIDLQAAWTALSDILGEHVRPDVLDAIFEKFCVGK